MREHKARERERGDEVKEEIDDLWRFAMRDDIFVCFEYIKDLLWFTIFAEVPMRC